MAIFIGNPRETSLSDDWGAESNKRDMPNSQQRRRGIHGRDVGRRAQPILELRQEGWLVCGHGSEGLQGKVLEGQGSAYSRVPEMPF